jgi:uncharacterized protein (DUF58 family)
MIPRARLSWCLALALAASAWGAFDTRGRLLAMALDALLFGLAFIDFARTPRPRDLHLERTLPARAGLGVDFKRRIRVEARTKRAAGLTLELDEEFGQDLEVRFPPQPGDPSGGPDAAQLPASGALELVRVYRSRVRGVHRIGHVRVRISSPWKLWWRQERLGGEQRIEIEPPLTGLRRTLQLAESERWRDPGVRKLRRRGGLSEFESLRELVHGDDLRLVDWKAFAKRGRPIVRQYQEERGQELILVFDAGRRMAATSAGGALAGWSKLDHALDAGLQIAAVALRQGDRVGALAFDSVVRRWIPPMRSAAQQERLRDALFDLEPCGEESDLERALRELGLRHRRRAYVVILSDVADPLSLERQQRALRAASKRHKVLFAALDDPSLRAAAEGSGGADALLRAAAVELMGERQTSLRALGSPGVRVLDALPAEAAAPLLAAWLSMRRGG